MLHRFKKIDKYIIMFSNFFVKLKKLNKNFENKISKRVLLNHLLVHLNYNYFSLFWLSRYIKNADKLRFTL